MDEVASASHRARRYVVLGLLLLLAGAGLIAGSVAYRGSDLYAATVMVSVGAGLLPTGTVVLLEPWLMRNVSKSARQIAEMSAQQAVADVRDRLDALAQIRDIQTQADTQHESDTANIAEALLAAPSYGNMWRLLQRADSLGLFAHDVWVKDSEIDRYLIRFDVMEDDLGTGRDLPRHIRVTLGELRDDLIGSVTVDKWITSGSLQEPNRPGVVTRCWSRWDEGMTFRDAYAGFRDACAKAGLSGRLIDWGRCLDQLVENFENTTLRTTEGVPSSESVSRPLKLNINQHWYIVEPNRLVSRTSEQSYSWDQLFGSGSNKLLLGHDNDDDLWQEALHYARYVMAPPSRLSDLSRMESIRRLRGQTSHDHLAHLIAGRRLTARQVATLLRGDLYRRDRTDLELLLRNMQFTRADALHKQMVTDFIRGKALNWSTRTAYIIGLAFGSCVGSSLFNRQERIRLKAKSIRGLREYYRKTFGESEEERLKGVLRSPSRIKRTWALGECWGIEASRQKLGHYD